MKLFQRIQAFGVLLPAAMLICGVAASGAGLGSGNDKDNDKDKAKDAKAETRKVETRNNAASLLADLVGSDKDVSKILIIKHNSKELGELMKSISDTAGDDSKKLEAMAKSDPSLNLKAMQLPPGEAATRAAVSKTKEHELLSSSGETFELNLLLTQTEALNYGSHLAKVAAENSSSEAEQRDFNAMSTSLDQLYQKVVAAIRTMPRGNEEHSSKEEKKGKSDKPQEAKPPQ